jgi:hypothetical protein
MTYINNALVLKLKILSFLVDILKKLINRANNTMKEELSIIFYKHKDVKVLSYNNNNDEQFAIIVLGNEYEFKKLQLLDKGLSVYLVNHKGQFLENYIPYDAIVGFINNNTYLYSYNDEDIKNITLKQIFHKSISLNNILNEHIHKIFENFITNDFHKDQIIKITFLKDYNNKNVSKKVEIGDKLLVLLLKKDTWQIKLLSDGLSLSPKQNNLYKEKNLFIPYNSIVTCFDTSLKIFINRNVKIIEEDFVEIDLNVFEEQNLLFVDFKKILDEEVEEDNEDDIKNFFDNSLFNSDNFIKNKKTTNPKNITTNLNNLIYGKFDKDKKE